MPSGFTCHPWTEPYDPPVYCQHCGLQIDGYEKAEDHEPSCPHSPDYRADLFEELAELDLLRRVPATVAG